MAKVLVIGGGGREHTLAEFIGRSKQVDTVLTLPGNPGTAGEAAPPANPPPLDNFELLADFAVEQGIDLTVVGPEAPLCDGIVDVFQERNLTIFGPLRSAARLEGDKAFARQFMKKHGIPQPEFEVFGDLNNALAYLNGRDEGPVVVKAAGLAAGKGVLVCTELDQARRAVRQLMGDRRFGSAGETVVIEAFMDGEEASILAICDGQNARYLVSSQDHKRIYDGDKGPNTGGMGAYAPAPVVTPEVQERVDRRIIQPVLEGLAAEGIPYRGCLYAGLMIKDGQPSVVEFNCRFGDPETQAVLPLLENDLYELLLASAAGTLENIQITHRRGAACCVVLASGGYPGSYEKGKRIEGLDEAAALADVFVFHAGTAVDDAGHLVTAGGRVLGVTGVGDSIERAVECAYAGVEKIQFDNCVFRRDIAHRAISRLS